MNTIPLTKGFFAIVDEEDYESIASDKWHICKRYARKYSGILDGKKVYTTMHHAILNIKPDKYVVVDHINRNTLDNRKSNLRLVNRAENFKNSLLAEQAVGVTYYPRSPGKPWRAYYRNRTLGYFHTKEEALKARQLAVIEVK